MDISAETAREKLERWLQDSSELVLLFKVFGMNGVIAGKIEVLEDKCISLNINPAPGLIRVWLENVSFGDDPSRSGDDTLTVKFSQGGECKLLRRTINDWPEIISDELISNSAIEITGR